MCMCFDIPCWVAQGVAFYAGPTAHNIHISHADFQGSICEVSLLFRKSLKCYISDGTMHMQVISEIEGGLQQWKDSGRWEERGIVEQVAQKEYRWSY